MRASSNFEFMSSANNLPWQEFLSVTGVTLDELNAEALKPQPACLSLFDYNNLMVRVSQSHPTFDFSNKARRLRVMRRGALPSQILLAEANIRAWKREIQALHTCEKADQVLANADAEMKLLDRMGNSGVVSVCEANPLKRKRKIKMDVDDEAEGPST